MDTAAEVVNLLINKGMTISFAESCTGGLAAARIVDVPDASRVLNASVVTYASESKIRFLDVKPETIDTYNVVSREVAYEMAEGVARLNNADVGVGITGLAGPSGGTAEIPVGTVCFGISINGQTESYRKEFGNIGRNEVRKQSVDFVMELIRDRIS